MNHTVKKNPQWHIKMYIHILYTKRASKDPPGERERRGKITTKWTKRILGALLEMTSGTQACTSLGTNGLNRPNPVISLPPPPQWNQIAFLFSFCHFVFKIEKLAHPDKTKLFPFFGHHQVQKTEISCMCKTFIYNRYRSWHIRQVPKSSVSDAHGKPRTMNRNKQGDVV